MSFRIALVTAACAPVLLASSVFAAQITDPTLAAVYAGHNITFGGFTTVSGAPVVANGSVYHAGGTLNVGSIYAGGSFNAGSAAFQNSTGEWLFNGNIANLGGPGSTLGGPVTSATGNVTFRSSSQTVSGGVNAAGDISLPGGTYAGNVHGGGNVTVGGTVNGNVVYGGAYSTGPFGTVSGTVTNGGAYSPTAYAPLTTPAGSGLTAGTSDVNLATFETRTLTPGVYGDLNFAGSNTVNLSAGTYVFSSITNASSLNQLSFNTTGGAIKIYVAGDLDFNLAEVLNGQALGSGTPNVADAAKVSIEVAGNYIGETDLYGSIYAPNGDVTLSSFVDITGRVLAGHDVTMLGSNTVSVPEPAALAAVAMAGMATWRRRRR